MKRTLWLLVLAGCLSEKARPDHESTSLGADCGYPDEDGDGFGDEARPEEACERPEVAVEDGTDCDDADPDVFPDAPEVCDGVDDDCDGRVDDDDDDVDATTGVYTWADADGDTFGNPATGAWSCVAGTDRSLVDTDCDDTDDAVSPQATEVCNDVDDDCDTLVDEGVLETFYADTDGDGFGDAGSTVEACSAPWGSVADDADCDDADSAVFPGGAEVCNGVDDDCDGVVDADDSDVDLATGVSGWYDADADGYGDAAVTTWACTLGSDSVLNDDDCDDGDSAVSPAAPEVCNGVDDDCDRGVDADDADVDRSTGVSGWDDADGDGYGDATSATWDCTLASGSVLNDDDCNDGDSAVSPAATEVCNSVDDDCDRRVDADDAGVDHSTGVSGWDDADGDGYGDPASVTWDCTLASGSVLNDDDCDDGDSAVSPAGAEVCNGVDDDCDRRVDADDAGVDRSTGVSGWDDADGDGYGDPASTTWDCTLASGSVLNDDDCDDGDSAVFPAATEVCNGVDDDCDGSIADETCGSPTCEVDFSDAYTAFGTAGDPTDYYGAYGLTFTMSEGYGLIGGDLYGDPGNWSDPDTVPDPAWGMWDHASATNTLTFSSEVTNVSFDLERTGGAKDITVGVDSYLAGVRVGTTSVHLVGASSVQTLSLSGGIDEVRTSITGSAGFAYAMDNLWYETTGSCPP